MKGEWQDRIRAMQGVVHGDLPGFSLLVGMLPSHIDKLRAEPWVEAITPYRPAMKISPKLRPGVPQQFTAAHLAAFEPVAADDAARQQIEVSVFPGESTAVVAARVRGSSGVVIRETASAVQAVVPIRAIAELAGEPGVQAIVPMLCPNSTTTARPRSWGADGPQVRGHGFARHRPSHWGR